MPTLSRRRLLAALTAPGLTACGRAAAVPGPDPADPVYERLDELERQYNAYIGLFATDLATGRTLAHRDDDPFAMCSTFKAYAAARVLQQAQRDELDLQQTVFIDPGDLRDPTDPGLLLPNSPVTAIRPKCAPNTRAKLRPASSLRKSF